MTPLKLVGQASWRLIPTGLLIWIAAFVLVNCTGKEPIRVGFVAQLTGVQAELGVQERNGVQWAVEEINAAGGVAGRPIELVIRDDLGTPEGAQVADRELIAAGVVAIIGHATSAQAIAGLAVTNPAHIVMLSPTVTTPELSGLDDYFFRMGYSLVDRARLFAQRVYQGRGLTQVAVIYDSDNSVYSKPYLDAFAAKYQSLGGKLVAKADFSSKARPDFASLVSPLRAGNPGGLLIIAADIDTALIAQRTRLMGWPIPLFTTSWAQTDTLINDGGQAVEGLEVEAANPVNNQTPSYLDFQAHYQTRFGQPPAFGAAQGYESAQVLAVALQKTGGSANGLKQALLSIQNFKGLTDTFSFDKYGDVLRPFHLVAIREGKYVDIESLIPTEP